MGDMRDKAALSCCSTTGVKRPWYVLYVRELTLNAVEGNGWKYFPILSVEWCI